MNIRLLYIGGTAPQTVSVYIRIQVFNNSFNIIEYIHVQITCWFTTTILQHYHILFTNNDIIRHFGNM